MAEPTAIIAVVDDETELREAVAEYLGLHGFKVVEAASAAAFRQLIETQPVELAILDVNMPGQSGLSLARYLRENSDIGIVMLTAQAEPDDRIAGLELGADDYVGKPFELRELLARVKAVLRRRSAGFVRATAAVGSNNRAFAGFILDLDARELRRQDGSVVPLTAMEYDLLRVFVQNPLKALSRDRLIALAHDRDEEPFERSIDVRVTRLRRKLEVDASKPQIIRTVRGAGYMFVPEPSR
jgi:two-component system phosphate regulon response regulator OmpR